MISNFVVHFFYFHFFFWGAFRSNSFVWIEVFVRHRFSIPWFSDKELNFTKWLGFDRNDNTRSLCVCVQSIETKHKQNSQYAQWVKMPTFPLWLDYNRWILTAQQTTGRTLSTTRTTENEVIFFCVCTLSDYYLCDEFCCFSSSLFEGHCLDIMAFLII